MNNVQNRGLSLIALIIVAVVVILIIFGAIMIFHNSGGGNGSADTEKLKGLDKPPSEGRLYQTATDDAYIIQTGDKTLYFNPKKDINIGKDLALKKDLFYKITKSKDKIKIDTVIGIDSGDIAFFMVYEDGTVERIDIITDTSKIKEGPFIVTPLPEYKDIKDIFTIGNEVKGKNSNGDTIIIFTRIDE